MDKPETPGKPETAETPRIGRPPTGRMKQIYTAFPDKVLEDLEAQAEQEGISAAELIRRLVEVGFPAYLAARRLSQRGRETSASHP